MGSNPIVGTISYGSQMTLSDYKEANRLFWIIKGHLIPIHWDEKSIHSVYNSYFERVWKNEESYTKEIGFAEAWQQRLNDIDKVSFLKGE